MIKIMTDTITKIGHVEELVYNSAGQHVGTYHYWDGVQTDTSWVIDGEWKHSASYKGTPQSNPVPKGHKTSFGR